MNADLLAESRDREQMAEVAAWLLGSEHPPIITDEIREPQ